MQRKDAARLGASRTSVPRTPTYQSYQSPSSNAANSYDSYEAEKNKTYTKCVAANCQLFVRLTRRQGVRTQRKGYAAWKKVQNY